MRVKYIPVFTEDINEQTDFLTRKLGFKISDKKLTYENNECRAIEAGADTYFILIERTQGPGSKNHIILNTEDCLNDYHALKTNGVAFLSEPQYLPTGLAANFSDNSGNSFLLLEERNYNE
jgi:predicted enzyme related to lactoylglutathione lyase